MIAAVRTIEHAGYSVDWGPLALASVVTLVSVTLVVARQREASATLPSGAQLAATALVLLVIVFPAVPAGIASGADGMDPIAQPQECLSTFLSRTAPDGAGGFLQNRKLEDDPFRYVGYAGRNPQPDDDSYAYRRCSPEVLAVMPGGQAARLELESIQGYNPLHLAVYADYIDTMNGGDQNYHWTDPYPATLVASPLLDMLNVRYIVVALDGTEADILRAMTDAGKREVFRNDQVVVMENPTAFPRAWMVHDLRQATGPDGLAQFASGAADGHDVAFIDGALPLVEPVPAGAGPERVSITDQEADSLVVSVEAQSAGVVVFSEMYAPGWVARVDGEEVDVLQVNHALRGVPVLSGSHTVTLSYEPTSLRIGLWVSGLTGGAWLALVGAAIASQAGAEWRRRRP